MKQHTAFALIVTGLIILLMSGVLVGCSSTPAAPVEQPVETTEPSEPTSPPAPAATAEPELQGDPVRGGLLYDQWMEALGVDAPAGDHPLWKTQITNTRSGADT